MSDRDYRKRKPRSPIKVIIVFAILLAIGLAGKAKADEVRLLCVPSEDAFVCVLLLIEEDDEEVELIGI